MRYSLASHNLANFMAWFVGDFDNAEQVAAERATGMQPRLGGGHEHIHCSIRQISSDLLFARYYFNGDPSMVFRSRVYRVSAMDSSERGILEMRIFRLFEETERLLQNSQYDLSSVSWEEGDMYEWLRGCEVFWELYRPPRPGDVEYEKGARDAGGDALGIHPGDRYVGFMQGGGCEVYSTEIGGRIKVLDDLLLTEEELWVADRGFDQDNKFVYGNRRGVPYKMNRVRPGDANSWTLSVDETPPDGYIP